MATCRRVQPKSPEFILRIWGSGVRISSGAPSISNSCGSAPFEMGQVKRFFKRCFVETGGRPIPAM